MLLEKLLFSFVDFGVLICGDDSDNDDGKNILFKKKKKDVRTFMVVQWLKLHFPMQKLRVQSLVRELNFHMPCSQKTKMLKVIF